MRLTTKDTVGIVLVLGTFSAVLAHNNTDHRETHLPAVADAGGAATSAKASTSLAFVDFNVVTPGLAVTPGLTPSDPIIARQVVVVEDGFVTESGPVGVQPRGR